MFHLDIDENAAFCADRMVVPRCHPVKAARTIAKIYLGNMPRVLEIAKTIVNRRETDARQLSLSTNKDLTRREMFARLANDRQHNLPLPRQSQILYLSQTHYTLNLSVRNTDFFIRLRIILIYTDVKGDCEFFL